MKKTDNWRMLFWTMTALVISTVSVAGQGNAFELPTHLNFSYIDWLLVPVGPRSGGFSYEIAGGAYPSREPGRRVDKPDVDVRWPTERYYRKVLGEGGYEELKGWEMTPVVIYAEKGSSPEYHRVQDMVEGSACVDDTARGALLFADDYLFTHDQKSLQRLRGILTWLSYMTTLDGRVYNFVWLDAPKFFGGDPIQAQNKHYGARFDFFARSEYPPNFMKVGGNPNADPEGLLKDDSGKPVRAPPFIEHAPYSIVMNDLIDQKGRDVAQTYNAPLYRWERGNLTKVGSQAVRVPVSTSFSNFSIWDARAVLAFSRAMLVLREGSVDETFRRFVENTTNRLYANLLHRNLSEVDPKMAAILSAAVVDYLDATSARPNMKAYLLSDGRGTGEADDAPPDPERMRVLLSTLLADLLNKQVHSQDWRDGQFINKPGGHWTAWGELQIYSLAHAYRYERASGGGEPGKLLDAAVQAAEHFYGQCAFSYKETRSTQCGAGLAEMDGNTPVPVSDKAEIVYQKAPMIMGLYELSAAVAESPRRDAEALSHSLRIQMGRMAAWFVGNNVAHQPIYDEATGMVADGIIHGARKDSSGGESNVEGLRALLYAKQAIAQGWIGRRVEAPQQ
jgi:hypothetical protein